MNRAGPRSARRAGRVVRSGVMQEAAARKYRGSGYRTTGHHCQTQEPGCRTPAAGGIGTGGHRGGHRSRGLSRRLCRCWFGRRRRCGRRRREVVGVIGGCLCRCWFGRRRIGGRLCRRWRGRRAALDPEHLVLAVGSLRSLGVDRELYVEALLRVRFNPGEVQRVGLEASSPAWLPPPELSSSPMNTLSVSRTWRSPVGGCAVKGHVGKERRPRRSRRSRPGRCSRRAARCSGGHRTPRSSILIVPLLPGGSAKAGVAKPASAKPPARAIARPVRRASRATCMNSPEKSPCQRPPVWPLRPQQRNSPRTATRLIPTKCRLSKSNRYLPVTGCSGDRPLCLCGYRLDHNLEHWRTSFWDSRDADAGHLRHGHLHELRHSGRR